MASVTTVHLVRPVLANPEYQYMLFDLPEDEMPSFELFDGTPRGSAWTPMPVYVPEPKLEEPEVWHLGVSLFVMSRQTVDFLEPFVAHSAELLPLTTSDGRADLVAVNVVRTYDCLSPNAVRESRLASSPISWLTDYPRRDSSRFRSSPRRSSSASNAKTMTIHSDDARRIWALLESGSYASGRARPGRRRWICSFLRCRRGNFERGGVARLGERSGMTPDADG
jgi:hypothetical protein